MLQCIAIDDEPLALELLEDFIIRVPFLQLVKKCNSAFEAIELLQKEHIDLLFLDIQMPDITGVQFLKSLENKPKVIFTTAYPDYAIEGFNLDAVDYLLKPFAFERFLKAANKAYQQIRSLQKVSPAVQATAQKKYMFIKSGYDTVKVNFKDILFIEGAKDYVTIYMKEKKIMMLISMKAMLELLPVNNFVRIHRSYIVALDKIDLIQTQDVQIGKKELPIGETYKREFLTLIDNLK